jgi:16S rRNA (cytosine1402-N4)-methyltransferase
MHTMHSQPPRHTPVLLDRVLEHLAVSSGQTIVDCTLGGGGHAEAIAARLAPAGRLIGLDQDESMLAEARARLRGLPVELVHANFDQLRPVLNRLGIDAVDAVLADLGVCSEQLDDPERGLSFMRSGPLDMRLDRSAGPTAAALVAQLNERDLARIFFEYGEERFSRRVARRIVDARARTPIATTAALAELVRRAVPHRGGIDPATRVFQALRIAVNDELGALERLLAGLPHCLRPGGRAAIISFHSLEDRLVKRAFKQKAIWRELTRKPLQPTEEETRGNPRARSAKMRAAESCMQERTRS